MLGHRQTAGLTAGITQTNCTGLTTTWASANSGVASVSTSGLVTAVGPGTVNITATVNGVVGTAVILVETAPLGVLWDESRLIVAGPSNGPFGYTGALFAASPTDLFTATNGSLYRYNGSSWSKFSQDAFGVEAMWGSGPNEVLGVGQQMLKWNGTAWTELTAPTSQRYRAVWGSAPGAALAVGNGGVIASYNGTSWSSMPSPTTTDLLGVAGFGTNFAVAVGDGGTILTYNGTTWTPAISPTTATLLAVWLSSPTSGYAVGVFGTVLRLTGTTWTVEPGFAGNPSIWAIWGSSPTNIFVAGSTGFLAHSNGSNWTEVPRKSLGDYRTLSGSGSTVFGGGEEIVFTATSAAINPLAYAPNLTSVWAPDANTAYAVGNGIVWKYSAGTWAELNPGGLYRFNDVWAAGPNEVYATAFDPAGNQTRVLRYNGSAWQSQSIPPSGGLVSLWGPAPNGLVAVSRFSPILRYDGTSWSPATAGPPGEVAAMWGTSATDYLLVGGGGFVARYDGGSTVTPVTSPTSRPLISVWGTSPTNYYAGTNGSEIFRFNGTSWSTEATGAIFQAIGFSGTGPNDVLLVTGDLQAIRYDGTGWRLLHQGGGRGDYAVVHGVAARAFAVGYNGAVAVTR